MTSFGNPFHNLSQIHSQQYGKNKTKRTEVQTRNKIERKIYPTTARMFIEYHLFFKVNLGNNGICGLKDNTNITDQLIALSVDMCVNENYSIRTLQRNQIVWKPKNEINSNKKLKSNISNIEDADNKQNFQKDTENEKIHEHLAFLLLLPNHPFSQDMLNAVTTVAPLYPSVTFVAGNAYEFKDMCLKYLINSFPTILFFEKGNYYQLVSGHVVPSKIAAKLSKWTRKLPAAIPIERNIQKSFPSVHYIELFNLRDLNYSWIPKAIDSIKIPVPSPNMEPFLDWMAEIVYTIPPLLTSRTIFDENLPKTRVVDNEEMTILGILDEDGKISSGPSLSQFMVLLTRLNKVDHRALCIQILLQCCNIEYQKLFVQNGGYKILKRWIKIAEDEEYMEELRSIVSLCKKLPFHAQAAKQSEIGKTIKKLLKLKSNTPSKTTLLHEEVKNLMIHWSEQMSISATTQVEEFTDLPDMAIVNAEIEFDVGTEPKKNEVKSETKVTNDEKFLVESQSKDRLERKPIKNESETQETQKFPSFLAESLHFLPNSIEAKHDSMHTVDKSIEFEPQTMSILPSFNSNPIVGPLKGAISTRERKSTDMAENARKLLELRTANKVQSIVNATDQSNKITKSEESSSEMMIDPVVSIQPLKSGLKKKREGISTTELGVIKKLNVQWADENGGMLREIHTIEVEKIKNSIASYKNHKDLVKKERQFEKETHLSKIKDAMHRTTKWRVPVLLDLPFEVKENSQNPVNSNEKEVQSRRLSQLLEIRYLDDSLIPLDPDETHTPLYGQTATTYPPGDSSMISWFQVGTDEETSVNQMIQMMHHPPPSSSSSHSSFYHNTRFNEKSGNDDPYYISPLDFKPLESAPYYNNSWNSNHGGFGGSNETPQFGSDNLTQTILLSLKNVEPEILQQILVEPHLLGSIMNPNGTVNEEKLSILRMQLRGNQSGHHSYNPSFNAFQSFDSTTRDGMNNQMFLPDSNSSSVGNTTTRPKTRWGNSTSIMPLNPSLNPSIHPDLNSASNSKPMHRRVGSRFSDKTQPTLPLFDPMFPQNLPNFDFGMNNSNNKNNAQGFDDMNNLPDASYGDSNSFSSVGFDVLGNAMSPSFLSNVNTNYANNANRPPSAKVNLLKGKVACRFFNTPKGCQHGDKCDFAHVRDEQMLDSSRVMNQDMTMNPLGGGGVGGLPGGLGVGTQRMGEPVNIRSQPGRFGGRGPGRGMMGVGQMKKNE